MTSFSQPSSLQSVSGHTQLGSQSQKTQQTAKREAAYISASTTKQVFITSKAHGED